MSAFAVIYNCSNMPRNPGVFDKLMERLSHRGPDGSDVWSFDSITMGHWHFWTTPEEVGECQPMSLGNLPFTIVLDGRIDNRVEILSLLGIDAADSQRYSDAALILKAFERWHTDCFHRFVGEFALVIFDRSRNELICARDHLGDRTLFYSAGDNQFVIASEAWAVAGAKDSELKFNESMIAHYFALKVPADGQSFYSDVYELLPAHVLVANTSGHTVSCYWKLDPDRKLRFKTDEEYADRFCELLEESVRCRMRSTTPVGVLMSGGLDSTSIACLAARLIAPQRLTAISTVFDELSECDERKYIDSVCDRWDMHSIRIPADEDWPLKNWEQWPHNPNHPEGNIYRLLHDRTYQRASAEGIRVLFSGHVGDALYLAGEEWFADLILEGKFSEAWSGLKLPQGPKHLRFFLESGQLRASLRALLRRFAPWVLNWRRRKAAFPAWVSPLAREYLGGYRNPLPRGLERYGTLLGPYNTYSCSHGSSNVSRFGIELRLPYRDRRLVEYIVSIPAYMLYQGSLYKRILRMAMHGILPEDVRNRQQQTSLNPLYNRGLDREKGLLHSSLYGSNHLWARFVDSNWLLQRVSDLSWNGDERIEMLLIWLCMSFERWSKLSTESQTRSL